MKKNIFLLFGVFFISLKGISFQLIGTTDPVKIHITFNQPVYVPGDTAYFRGHLLAANNLKPVSGKHVVNIKLLTQNNEALVFERVVFNEGIGISQIILPNDLTAGVYNLVAYSDEMAKLSNPESFFYTRIIIAGEKEIYFIQNTNPKYCCETDEKIYPAIAVDINLEQTEYSVRTPVNLDIQIKNLNNLECASDFSISVYKEELFPVTHQPGLSSIKPSGSHGKKLNRQTQKPLYFSGKAYYSTTKKTVPDSTFVTFYLSRQKFTYGLHIKKDGNFDFPLFIDFDDDDLFYVMQYKGKLLNDVKIDVKNYSIELKEELRDSVGKNLDPYAMFSNLKKTIHGSFIYFSNKYSDQPAWVENAKPNQSFSVDYTIELDKFKEFATMQEVLHEIVPLVQCRPIDGKIDVRIFLQKTAMIGGGSPLYIIDNIMTDSTDYFLSIEPSQVYNIGVMRTDAKLKKYGALGKNGILVVNTKSRGGSIVPKSSRAISITGVNKAYRFILKNYKPSNQWGSRIPDLRSTLYWNPQILTTKGDKTKISFFTGDATGFYRIQIEGVTNEGLPFSYHKRFNVSEKIR